MNVFDTLHAVGAAPASTSKEHYLTECRSTDLKVLLLYTYNPFMTYRVNQIDYPENYNNVQPDVMTELFQLCDLLAEHNTTPTAARAMIKRLLEKCTEENAKMLARVFQKDLKIGIGPTLINKLWPSLIPQFYVQLALPMEKLDKKTMKIDEFWSTLVYPVIMEEKYNGMRIIAVCDGVTVRYYSRDGLEYTTLDHLTKDILALRPGTKYVLDGEIIGIKYNPNCKAAKKNFDAGIHWEFSQGLSMAKKGNTGDGESYPASEMRECIGYMTWDVIDYEYFNSAGLSGVDKNLKERKMELAAMFLRHEDNPSKNVIQSPARLAFCREDIKAFLEQVLADGGEGVMVKRLDRPYLRHNTDKKGRISIIDRTDSVLKVKEFKTADLFVIGAFEGKKGTKIEGMLGGLVVGDGTISAEVGSGFDEDSRVSLWLRHLRGELKGCVVEVQYFEVTADNSLLLPTFLRERPDKTECSWN